MPVASKPGGWRLALLVSVALAALLAWVLRGGAALTTGDYEQPAPSGKAAAAPVTMPKAPDLLAALDFSAIAERPLFSPDRRPPPVDQQAPQGTATSPVSATPPPKLTLSAIIGDAGSWKAMLVAARGGEVRLVSEGDKVDGWMLESIKEESVVLTLGERREELQLRTFDAPPPGRRGAAAPRRVTPRTLRFYEYKELLSPIREGQKRLFTNKDRARLKLILRGKRFGFSLAELKDLLDLYEVGDSQVTQLTETLKFAEKHLAEMVAQRNELNEAISDLEVQMKQVRAMLSERTREAS